MTRLRSFLREYYRYVLLVIIAALLLLVMHLVLRDRSLTPDIWLPGNASSVDDSDAFYELPVKSESVNTKYGRATLYTSTDDWAEDYDEKPWTYIYQFGEDDRLKPADCPNIMNRDSVVPSGCDQVGMLAGNPVYHIHRALPSEMGEYYVRINDQLLYVVTGDGGDTKFSYLRSFTSQSPEQAKQTLATNHDRVQKLLAKKRVQKAANDKDNAASYTKLGFNPAWPQALPTGWSRGGNIYLDGPDVQHPNMVSTYYVSADQQQSVRFFSMHRPNIKVGTQCGPTLNYSMEYLPCHQVAGTNYYEAYFYTERNDLVRYLYYPIGDSLVVSGIWLYADDNRKPTAPAGLLQAQDAITTSAQPVDKNTFKGSIYAQTFY